MKIEMLQPMSGPKISWNRGEVIELKADEAHRLVEAGFAKPAQAPATKKAPAKRKRKRIQKAIRKPVTEKAIK